MTRKILVAGMVAGLVLFLWESVAHMVLPLGEAGVKALPNEATVLAALKDNIKAPGFYFFPAGGIDQPGMTKEQQQKAFENQARMMRAGPSGIMIVHPEGLAGISAANLVTQFASDVIVMLLAAFLLARATMLAGFGARVGFVAMLGLIPTLRVDLPQWNWNGFPAAYTAAQLVMHLVGFAAGGLVLARLIGGQTRADRDR